MCIDPATLSFASQLLLGVQAASAVVSYFQQDDAADAQAEAIQRNYEQQLQVYQEQQRQNSASAAQEMSERAREAMIERARLRVISAESGLAGISTDRLMNASRFSEGQDISSIEANRRSAAQQLYNEARGLRAQAKSRINAIDRPSVLGTGLQIVGSIAQAGAEQERLKALSKK